MIKTAKLSRCKRYRYRLSRQWKLKYHKTCLFIMLNPSTADAFEDDPTIRRCISFAKREKCDRLEVVNLMAYRATKPTDLPKDPQEAMGPSNMDHVVRAVVECNGPLIAAWGSKARGHQPVAEFLKSTYQLVYCLGTTKHGAPRHPLYLRADQPLERWN